MRQLAMACLVLWCRTVLAGEPSREQIESARIHFQSGREYYRIGQHAQAFTEFVEAYRIAPRAELLYNRGLCLEAMRLDAEALACYRGYLAESSLTDDRLEAEARVAELGRKLRKQGRTAGCPSSLLGLTVNPYKPLHKRWWPWTILGVGVALTVGLGVGLGVGLREPPSYRFPVVQ